MTSPTPVAPPFLPLATLLQQGRPGNTLVAFGRQGRCRFEDLDRRVAGVAAAIREQGRGSWLVHCSDTYATAIGFLALLHEGCQAIFLPSRQPGVLARLQEKAAGILMDVDGNPPPELGVPRIDPLAARPADVDRWKPLERDAWVAEFLTSGTTGEAKTVPKRLRHLDDEVAVLEDRFARELSADTRVFATVSPQHIYGLLFRVLWPLCSGRAFWRDPVLHPEEFLPSMAAEVDCSLATTPALLKSPKLLRGLEPLAGRCRAVFSSGGLLQGDTAVAVHSVLGVAPFEILGSTEPGGAAVRQRRPAEAAEETPWRALPGVEITRDGPDNRMVVTSPFVSVGEDAPAGARQRFVTGDQIRFVTPQTFRLLGRADRIVKIGEKRLALPDMEKTLCAEAWVDDAALVVLDVGGTARVHAAVALNPEGRTHLKLEGRRATGQRLTARLLEDWDGILMPRAWRFVEQLPRDPQGKLSRSRLETLFSLPEDTGTPVRAPITLDESRYPRSITRRLEVPENLACLEGHFPGQPILPGLVQLRWALDCAREWLGASVPVEAMEALKFHAVLRPGDRFTLTLELPPPGNRLRISLEDGGRIFTTLRCLLSETMTAPEVRT